MNETQQTRKEYWIGKMERLSSNRRKAKELIGAGKSRKEVAETVGVSESTVLNWTR